MSTTRAFAYLVRQSAKNRLLSRLKRAKNPRYALAMIIGVTYLWLVYFRPQMRSRPPSAPGMPTETWMVIGTAVIVVMAGLAWFVDTGPSSLAMDDAESYFILPAPVSRRGLVGYKVMRAQLAVVLSVVIWSVLLRRSSQQIDWPLRAIGVWMFFTTTNLHRTGAELVRAAWAVRGGGALRAHWPATLAIIAIILGLATGFGINYNEIVAAIRIGSQSGIAAVAHALGTGPAGVVLWPIHAILAPMLAWSNASWLVALPGAIVVLAAHAIWVASADDQSIHAAVVKASDKLAVLRRTKAERSGGVTVDVRRDKNAVLRTMPLASTGWPGVAIVWKNILCLRRKARPTTLLTMLLLPIGLGAIFAMTGSGFAAGVVIGGFGAVGLMMIAGPVLMRTDLRTDMVNIVALKLMPLRGRTIVAAEVLSVVVPLGIVQAAILVATAFASTLVPRSPLSPADTLTVLLGAVPFLVVFSGTFVTIQNAAPVLFPAWAKLGTVSGGIEAIGQTAIVMAIMLGLLGLMLILPGALAAGVIFAGRTHVAPAIAAALLVASAVLAVEVAGVIGLLGRALERTEPSDVAASS